MTCGIPFDLPPNEYDGDRCDECARPFHSFCMHTFLDLSGEWLLCSACRANKAQKPNSVQGDFRRLPQSAWNNFYALFRSTSTEALPAVEAVCTRDDEQWTERQTGDYVMQLLAAYQQAGQDVAAYALFEQGIQVGMQKCPDSNRPWLPKLQDGVKAGLK